MRDSSARQEVKEHDEAEELRRMLDTRNYDSALKVAEEMENPRVCYYVSHYLDYLVPRKEIEEAKKVARLFGRCLDIYLLHVHGISTGDKPYKAKRRS